MSKVKISLLGLLVFLIGSCSSTSDSNSMKYCGYELTGQAYAQLRNKAEVQNSAYEADSLWHIYDQLNDSIRSVMPDSIDFEVFLSLLNDNEVGIDVIVPRNREFLKKISCVVMNGSYTGKMPEQRYLCLYTYTNDDGSGDSPLEMAVKRKK